MADCVFAFFRARNPEDSFCYQAGADGTAAQADNGMYLKGIKKALINGCHQGFNSIQR
ncbi:MAG: hypothetical protein LBQ28_08150 [Prevotellaceae bacterium]|nr:hypothetical protein [Prevotellaceae bacterium]